MMTTKTTDTAVEIAAQIQALQQQIETVEDSIGAAAVGWRQAAADPAASLRAAERIGLLERQRDMLQTAKGEAEQALATYKHDTNAERVEAAIGQAQQQVEAAMAQRVELGQELAAAVDRVAELIAGLYDQGMQVRHLFAGGSQVAIVSGVDVTQAATSINAESLQYCVDQVLAWKLGPKLWPTETSPNTRTLSIADRVARECVGVRVDFQQDIAARRSALQVPA